jgi:hypothetical protein
MMEGSEFGSNKRVSPLEKVDEKVLMLVSAHQVGAGMCS